MRKRYTKRVRLNKRKTRRNRSRRHTRRVQRGGWGGQSNYQPKDRQNMLMMTGGWGGLPMEPIR